MRNFTFLLSVTIAATISSASTADAAVKRDRISAGNQVVTANSPIRTATGIKLKNSKVAAESLRLLDKKSVTSKISSRAVTDAVVEEKPEGTETMWARSSTNYEAFWGETYESEDMGLAVTMIDTGDGKVWMNNPISLYPVHSYIYANKTDEGLSIPAGQLVLDYSDEYEEVKLYVMPVEFVADDEGYFTPVVKPDEDFRLINDNGVLKSADENICLGLCGWDEEYNEYAWNGFGDISIIYKPMTEKGIDIPADLETSRWSYIMPTGEGYFVNFGIEGSSIYIQGIHPVVPDAWIKLDLNGNKAVMKTGQFLGEDYEIYHYAYAVTGTVEEVWDDDWEEYVDLFTVSQNIEFDYDAENKTLTTDKAIGFAPIADGTMMTSYIANPRFTGQIHKTGVRPTKPVITNVSPYNYSWEYGTIDFQIPCTDTDGALLDKDHLYYNMLVNGQIYEFLDDEYVKIPESPMVNVPFSYQDYNDFFLGGIDRTICLYFTGFENIGIQTIYMEEDENGGVTEVKSEIAYYEQDGISSVSNDSRIVKSVEYYDLSGRPVINPKNGLYVARIIYADGTVSNQKIHK